jgi:hypothetical protein
MTRPNNPMQQTASMTRSYVRAFKTITDNASRTDKDGDWGLDAWIRTIHELVDLQVRTGAAVLQAALAGPWWTKPLDEEPQPSDPVAVEAKNYPRTLAAASVFVRIGLPQMAIPVHSIGFDPELLPAGATDFRVVLKDYSFVGANYRGTVSLTPASGPKAAPGDTIEIVVGL